MPRKPGIKIKLKKVVQRKDEPYFYIVWEFYVDGRLYTRGTQFPFSMS
jgi:hypothetical protein